MIDAFGRTIRIDYGNHRNSELVGFGDGDLLFADVDDKNRIRQSVHSLNARKRLLQPLSFAIKFDAFLLC